MSFARALLLTLLIPTLVPHVPAGTGTIAGRVTDRGQPRPGVTVTIAAGNWLQTQTTGASGGYRIDAVPPGTYTAWFSGPGFRTEARRDVAVRAGTVTLDVPLTMSACDDCRPPITPEPLPQVRIETALGAIVVAVDPVAAPITAANFLAYVDGRFFDGGRFHRATRADNYVVNLPNRPLLQVIQAGINPDTKSKAFPPIPLERTSVTGLKHVVGTVSMARGAGADTATSDFFIDLDDQPSLDFTGKRFDDAQGAAAFGRVVSGMDVVRKIQQQPTSGQSLDPPIAIVRAMRVR
jgi:peptidyl-prolyl cis-trans isomerase A (cyclophilin A)